MCFYILKEIAVIQWYIFYAQYATVRGHEACCIVYQLKYYWDLDVGSLFGVNTRQFSMYFIKFLLADYTRSFSSRFSSSRHSFWVFDALVANWLSVTCSAICCENIERKLKKLPNRLTYSGMFPYQNNKNY